LLPRNPCTDRGSPKPAALPRVLSAQVEVTSPPLGGALPIG